MLYPPKNPLLRREVDRVVDFLPKNPLRLLFAAERGLLKLFLLRE